MLLDAPRLKVSDIGDLLKGEKRDAEWQDDDFALIAPGIVGIIAVGIGQPAAWSNIVFD